MKQLKANRILPVVLLCLLATVALCLGACGGGNGGTETTAPETSGPETSGTVPATETAGDTGTESAPADETATAPASSTESQPDTQPVPDAVTVHFTGEGVNIADQTVLRGGTALRPRDPEREGYAFTGWASGDGTLFDFSAPLTADLTLTAVWEDVRQDGSAEHPYRIATAEDLMSFSERLNNPDAEDFEAYCRAHFLLTADIDMSGLSYVSAGQTVVLNEGGENEVTLRGFMGSFDGGGHTVRNLTIRKSLRSTVYYVGLFGVTYRAHIHDLTLENISYVVESGANTSEIGVSVGGIAGSASLTTLFNVRVTGTVETRLCATNSAYIGGLCGRYSVSADGGTAYVAYVENCSTDVETVIGSFDDGEKGVLESAANGGLIGHITTSSSAASLLNCTVEGKVYGGQFVGGIVGYTSGSYISIVNCANYAPVTATRTDVTYTGGILGFSTGDNTVMDCVSLGRVKGVKAPKGSTYKSYAGGILGYAVTDDYDMYYDAGIAVVNCHYRDNVTTYDVRNNAGTKLGDGSDFTAAFARDTLRWDTDVMVFGRDGYARPAATRSARTSWTLTLVCDGEVIGTQEKTYADGMYAMAGTQNAAGNRGSFLFFDWELADGVRQRFYVPVVKDMTLTARYADVSGIAGIYTGKWTLHESGDAGTLVLLANGSLQWINDTVVRGSYLWDGEHIVLEFYSNIGEVSGTVTGDRLTYVVDAGMSGSVTYTFNKSDLRFVGEYYSADGDCLTFSGENGVAFRVETVRDGRPLSGTFTDRGGTLELSGFGDYYSSLSVTVNADGSLTVTAVSNGSKGKNLDAVRFAPPEAPLYEGKPFVGSYHSPYISFTSYDKVPCQEAYTLTLNADGTAVYQGSFSPRTGYYYVFRDGTYIVLTLEGYTSILRYDPEHNVIWGTLERGTYVRKSVILLPVSEGDVRVFVLNGDETSILVSNGTRTYLMLKHQIRFDVAVQADSLEDGARVLIGGQAYRVLYYTTGTRVGYGLLPIGSEEGTYTYGGASLTLDGIGNITGDRTGSYWLYGDGTAVMLFDNDELVAFSVTAAQADGGAVTAIAGDGYRGIWYKDVTRKDDDGNEYVIRKGYKLLLDGVGHATFMYWSEDYGAYRYNWGEAWTPYTLNDTGVHCQFNQYQPADIVFYYGMQMVYSKSFGYMGETVLLADGYDGPTDPPALPADLAGSYNGETADGVAVVFNLRQDMTGSWRGTPFSGIYDGAHSLRFTAGGVSYVFDTDALTLTGGGESIRLTRAGAVTEVIPAALCGTFSGEWTGWGISGGEQRTVTVAANGTVTYRDVVFAAAYNADGTVTGTSGNYTVRLSWNADSGSYSARVTLYDEEESTTREWTCALLTAVLPA